MNNIRSPILYGVKLAGLRNSNEVLFEVTCFETNFFPKNENRSNNFKIKKYSSVGYPKSGER